MPKPKPRKPAPPKPILALFVGDLQVGGDTGLCIPGYKTKSKDDRPYSASSDQVWLYNTFQTMISEVKAKAKGKRLFLGLGGDLVDGVQHHNTTQTYGTYIDEVYMARDLLAPLVNMADDCLGVMGTASHVGQTGEYDAAVYELMKVDYKARWSLKIGNRLLWWAHHGISIGSRAWTEDSNMILLGRSVALSCTERGVTKPDAIIAHDRHVSPQPINARGISVGVCPCWQLPTYYIHSLFPFGQETIGALTWDVDSNMMEVMKYAKPQTSRTAFSSARN